MTASRHAAASAGCSATASARPAVSTAAAMSASSAATSSAGSPSPEVAAGQRRGSPGGRPAAAPRPAAGEASAARPCPAARPTAGRRGRRRRRPASAARSSCAVGPDRPAVPVAVVVQHRPVGRVGGEVVGQAGAGARARRAAGCAAGAEPRSRASRAAAGPPVGVVAVQRLDQPVQRAGARGRGRRPGRARRPPGPASGSAGSLRSRSHRPERGVGQQPRGALAVLEAEADQPDDGPARDLPRRRALVTRLRPPAARRARTRSANRPAKGCPGLGDVGVRRLGAGADRLGVVRAGRDADGVAGRPVRGRSPASSRCGTAGRRRAGPTRKAWCA